MPSKIAVVIIAKNEEQFIGKTLDHLLQQDLQPQRIILVNDNSTDNTKEIVSKYKQVQIVNFPKKHNSWVTKKELATVFNYGLKELDSYEDLDFIMILGSDILLPSNYLSQITTRMIKNSKICISSGIIENEFSLVPRGAGRVIRYQFWKKIGLRYPINYGFEGYLLVKTKYMGFDVKVYPDLIMKTQRSTSASIHPRLFYNYGLGMKALGYTPPFALFDIFNIMLKKPIGGFHMLRGYLSRYNDLYEPELRNFVKKTQWSKIKNFQPTYFTKIFNLIRKK